MDVDHLLVNEGPVALLRVLLGGVAKETAADGLLDPHGGFAAGHHVQLVSEKQRLKASETTALFDEFRLSRESIFFTGSALVCHDSTGP